MISECSLALRLYSDTFCFLTWSSVFNEMWSWTISLSLTPLDFSLSILCFMSFICSVICSSSFWLQMEKIQYQYGCVTEERIWSKSCTGKETSVIIAQVKTFDLSVDHRNETGFNIEWINRLLIFKQEPSTHDAYIFFLVISRDCWSSSSVSSTLVEFWIKDKFCSVSSVTRSSSCWGLVKYSSGSSCSSDRQGGVRQKHCGLHTEK